MSDIKANRIDQVMAQLKSEGRKALVPYLPVGYPTAAHSIEFLEKLVDGGADIIELGVPFSDPMADGPVIQRATEIALEQGMTLRGVLKTAATFREKNQKTPLVMMTYVNPLEAMGYEVFIDLAISSGLDAVLLVDMPPEELGDLKQKFNDAGIYLIHFVAPTTTPARIDLLADRAQGFVYYVALKGVTGSGSLDTNAVNKHVTEVHKVLKVPVLVGFGIHDGASARAVSQSADGVIVGTALVNVITAGIDKPISEAANKVKEFVQDLRTALDEPNA